MHAQLIEKAIKKHGSIRALATALELDRANLSRAISAKKLAPQVAHAIAKDLGEDPQLALLEALAHSSRSQREREYWTQELLDYIGINRGR